MSTLDIINSDCKDIDNSRGFVIRNILLDCFRHRLHKRPQTKSTPGGGAAFFFHTTDGGPTAGCVAIDDAKLVQIIQWLRPGAVIAIAK